MAALILKRRLVLEACCMFTACRRVSQHPILQQAGPQSANFVKHTLGIVHASLLGPQSEPSPLDLPLNVSLVLAPAKVFTFKPHQEVADKTASSEAFLCVFSKQREQKTGRRRWRRLPRLHEPGAPKAKPQIRGVSCKGSKGWPTFAPYPRSRRDLSPPNEPRMTTSASKTVQLSLGQFDRRPKRRTAVSHAQSHVQRVVSLLAAMHLSAVGLLSICLRQRGEKEEVTRQQRGLQPAAHIEGEAASHLTSRIKAQPGQGYVSK